MNGTIREGMAQSSIRRVALGVLLIGFGGLLLFLAYISAVNPVRPTPLPPVIMLLLWLMMLGMGIVLPIAGIVSLVKAISAFHFKAPSSPEQTMTKFMKELLGGAFIPGNPAMAFLCLSNDCQTRWRDWKLLKKAMRLFTQSLKQKYNDTTLYFEITKDEVVECHTDGSVLGVVNFDVVFPGGPGDKAKRFSRKVEFSLIESAGRWYITDFQGGPSEFHEKDTASDLASPRVQSELKSANLLIRIGLFTLAVTIGSLVFGLGMAKGDAKFVFVFVVPFFVGFATLALIGNGLAKRSKYK